MRIIDLEGWDRRDHYRWYRAHAQPQLALTAELDAGGLAGRCEAEGRSLFAGFLRALSRAANAVPALRQRVRSLGGREVLVEHPVVHPAFTVALDGDRFGFASTPLVDDGAAFEAAVRRVSDEARAHGGLTPFDEERDDLLYLSCLPWVRFTHVSHPVRSPGGDWVPRIAWGRLTPVGGRIVVPVNIQVHHALVDGVHLGRFFEAAQAALR